MTSRLIALITTLVVLTTTTFAQSGLSRVGGAFVASNYAYGINPNVGAGRVAIGASASGSQTLTLASSVVYLPDGRQLVPYSTNAPIQIGVGTNAETVTPSAVSGCVLNNPSSVCLITATFSNVHGSGDFVASGTFGLQEAINDANAQGGGLVVVDQQFFLSGGAKSNITAVVSTTPKVWVQDISTGAPVLYGKSGTAGAAYSSVNNDAIFTVTLSGGAATKTLSQTYAVAPICVATDTTAAAATKTAPTTSTVVLAGTTTDVLAVQCSLQK